jgi:hypothetical protein
MITGFNTLGLSDFDSVYKVVDAGRKWRRVFGAKKDVMGGTEFTASEDVHWESLTQSALTRPGKPQVLHFTPWKHRS